MEKGSQPSESLFFWAQRRSRKELWLSKALGVASRLARISPHGIYHAMHNVHCSKTVLESSVGCAGIDQVRLPQLVDSPEPLERWVVNDLDFLWVQPNEAVHRYVELLAFLQKGFLVDHRC